MTDTKAKPETKAGTAAAKGSAAKSKPPAAKAAQAKAAQAKAAAPKPGAAEASKEAKPAETGQKSAEIVAKQFNFNQVTSKQTDVFGAARRVISNATAEMTKNYLAQLRDGEQVTEYFQGGLLVRMEEEEGFLEGYDSFKQYVEQELGIRMPEAAIRMRIYRQLNSSGIKWEDVSALDWSKIRALAGVLTTKNVKRVVKRVIDEDMNVPTVKEYAKTLAEQQNPPKASGEDPGTAEPSTSSGVKRKKTFSMPMYEDQHDTVTNAIAAYRDAVPDCGSDAVALENIALQYMAGGASGNADIAVSLQNLPLEVLVKAINDNRPELLEQSSDTAVGFFTAIGADKAIDILDAAFPKMTFEITG